MLDKIEKIPGVLAQALVEFVQGRHSRSASSLTITTLLALAPLIAILFVIVQWSPVFAPWMGRLEKFILAQFVPSASQSLIQYIQQFAYQGAQLTRVGFLFLIITALLIFINLQMVMDDIWHKVYQGVPLWASLLRCCLTVLLFPLVLSLSLYVRARLLVDWSGFPDVIIWVNPLLPFLINVIILTFLYAFTPVVKVPWRAAFVGAGVAVFLLACVKWLFAIYLKQFSTYTWIYGTLAAIPIIVIWIYTCWCIVIYGAVVTYILHKR